jgi:hypothetical protein
LPRIAESAGAGKRNRHLFTNQRAVMEKTKFHLLTATGLLTRENAKKWLAYSIKKGTFPAEFPEWKDKVLTDAHIAGESGDLDMAVELVNLGWPIVVFKADGREAYGIPFSYRERVDMKNQTLHSVN